MPRDLTESPLTAPERDRLRRCEARIDRLTDRLQAEREERRHADSSLDGEVRRLERMLDAARH